MVVGSSDARFISISANPGASFTSGSVSLVNSKDGAAVITATGLVPGSSSSGVVTLTAHGDYTIDVILANASISDQPVSPALSQALTLNVEDVTGSPTTLWSGTMNSLSSLSLGQISPGSARTFQFTVAFPMANAVAGLQNASTTMTLRFTGVAQ